MAFAKVKMRKLRSHGSYYCIFAGGDGRGSFSSDLRPPAFGRTRTTTSMLSSYHSTSTFSSIRPWQLAGRQLLRISQWMRPCARAESLSLSPMSLPLYILCTTLRENRFHIPQDLNKNDSWYPVQPGRPGIPPIMSQPQSQSMSPEMAQLLKQGVRGLSHLSNRGLELTHV